MQLSKYENEAALDLMADLIDPATAIFSDPEIKKLYNTGSTMQLVKYIMKNHKTPLIEILATLEGVPVKDYHANIPKMIGSLLDILNDKDLTDFFISAAPTAGQIFSGSAMESTEDKGE